MSSAALSLTYCILLLLGFHRGQQLLKTELVEVGILVSSAIMNVILLLRHVLAAFEPAFSENGKKSSIQDLVLRSFVVMDGAETVETDVQEEQQCSICLTALQAGNTVAQLRCHHIFHEQCIHPWLALNCSCPMRCKPVLEASAADDSKL